MITEILVVLAFMSGDFADWIDAQLRLACLAVTPVNVRILTMTKLQNNLVILLIQQIILMNHLAFR